MYYIRYKPEQGNIKIESFKGLQKFKDELQYMAKCCDIDLKQVWFRCPTCDLWMCYNNYKPRDIIKNLKNPLKREAYFYCKECAVKTVIKDAEERKQREESKANKGI
jgi:predicted RNA-binding Zn-ribbon protein involved in translation (DUF1610 family)